MITIKNPGATVDRRVKKIIIDEERMRIDVYTKNPPAETYEVVTFAENVDYSTNATAIEEGTQVTRLMFRAARGYSITENYSVSGAEVVDSSLYDYNQALDIDVTNATKTVVVNVETVEGATYPITTNLSGCYGYSTNPTEISTLGSVVTLTFTPYDGYEFVPSISVSGASYSWDDSTGELQLWDPTESVSIIISCVASAQVYPITTSLSGCYGYSTNPTEFSSLNSSVSLTFNMYSAYELSSVSVSGAEYDYYSSGSTVYVTLMNPIGPITVWIYANYASCCFVAGTPVLMADNTKKPIEQVCEDEMVMTYNEETQMYEPGVVITPIIKPYTIEMARLVFEDDSKIEMNAYHPMYTKEGWKSLTCYNDYPLLTETDSILSIDNKWLAISQIDRWINEELQVTYTLNVEENDNYFVGDTPVMAQNAHGGFVPSPCANKPAPKPILIE